MFHRKNQRMKSRIVLVAGLALAAFTPGIATADTIWLDKLDVRAATQGWGDPHKNKSVNGNVLTIGGKTFEHGFGTHAESTLIIKLDGDAKSFSASVGVDDEVNKNPASSVEFIVIGDGKELWHSGVMHAGDAAKDCQVDLSGVKALTLKVGDAGDGIDYDHADWVDAKFESTSATTYATSGEDMPEPVAPYILTPPAPATPRINGPNVFGVRPGSPFLYTIPATGERPMKFSVKGLPGGLKVDEKTGRITGKLGSKGEFTVTLRAKNILGRDEKKFRIVCGDQIALTPQMGWNSWNCFAHAVTADRVKRAADAMVKSGLINHGWTYINIDDYWENHRDSQDPTLQGKFRDEKGFVVPNSRFPSMKGLADYVHGLGLKIGLYSSPGPWTCGGCTGSFQHEKQDAETYANWGFDYLKYDWCSYGSIADGKVGTDTNIPSWSEGKGKNDVEVAIYPYRLMGKYLREQKRDIIFSLCQYGMSDVWNWGGSVEGNSWRTTGDITDTWRSMSSIGFRQDKAAPHAKPGNWNDPDMLIVGQVGWGNLHPTRLTADEQYTHISLWCMLSAPLLIGCDMEKFDDFTLSLLSNDEVLAIDQDALGKEAMCVSTNGTVRIYEKQLEDGGRAVGFFNLGAKPADLSFSDFATLNLSGKQHVRDLWRQKNLVDVDTDGGSLPLTVPAHGVVLYKFTKGK
jgi:alpha-galactosidase